MTCAASKSQGGGVPVTDVTPAGARLAVQDPPIPEDDGLWLPPEIQGADCEVAVVVKLGEDCKLPVQTGDRVYFHSGHFAKIGDTKIVPEDCVLAFEAR